MAVDTDLYARMREDGDYAFKRIRQLEAALREIGEAAVNNAPGNFGVKTSVLNWIARKVEEALREK